MIIYYILLFNIKHHLYYNYLFFFYIKIKSSGSQPFTKIKITLVVNKILNIIKSDSIFRKKDKHRQVHR